MKSRKNSHDVHRMLEKVKYQIVHDNDNYI
nr:MAG TPA: hypothetical protein [Caudoviricetes sp.]